MPTPAIRPSTTKSCDPGAAEADRARAARTPPPITGPAKNVAEPRPAAASPPCVVSLEDGPHDREEDQRTDDRRGGDPAVDAVGAASAAAPAWLRRYRRRRPSVIQAKRSSDDRELVGPADPRRRSRVDGRLGHGTRRKAVGRRRRPARATPRRRRGSTDDDRDAEGGAERGRRRRCTPLALGDVAHRQRDDQPRARSSRSWRDEVEAAREVGGARHDHHGDVGDVRRRPRPRRRPRVSSSSGEQASRL